MKQGKRAGAGYIGVILYGGNQTPHYTTISSFHLSNMEWHCHSLWMLWCLSTWKTCYHWRKHEFSFVSENSTEHFRTIRWTWSRKETCKNTVIPKEWMKNKSNRLQWPNQNLGLNATKTPQQNLKWEIHTIKATFYWNQAIEEYAKISTQWY